MLEETDEPLDADLAPTEAVHQPAEPEAEAVVNVALAEPPPSGEHSAESEPPEPTPASPAPPEPPPPAAALTEEPDLSELPVLPEAPSTPAPVLPELPNLPDAPSMPAPKPPVPAPPAAASSSDSVTASDDASPMFDVHLAVPNPRSMETTSLASTLEVLEHAGNVADLQSLLQQECVRQIAVGTHAEAVSRCCAYVGGLARAEEKVLCGWPVLSINEWGSQQVRTLVLSSHALYRVAFSSQKGTIDHYSRTSLGNMKAIERGRYAFKLLLTEPDGRENPITYFWTAYVKKGATDNRYERVYYPIHPEAMPVELALACIITSIEVANRLLVAAVGSYCYVTRLVVRDYVPNPNAVDEFMDKVGPALQSAGQKVSEAVSKLVQGAQHSARASSQRRSSSGSRGN